jgi:hypothetical protein
MLYRVASVGVNFAGNPTGGCIFYRFFYAGAVSTGEYGGWTF